MIVYTNACVFGPIYVGDGAIVKAARIVTKDVEPGARFSWRLSVPLVSIIIPVYKVEDVLQRCVDSVLSQSVADIEVILVDDGSPDGCPRMCDRYAETDKRVRVVHKENGGLSDARNHGLDIATGDYVMFVDSDDYIEQDSCRGVPSKAMGETGADIGVLGDWRVSSGKDKPDHYLSLVEGRTYSTKDFILRALRRRRVVSLRLLHVLQTLAISKSTGSGSRSVFLHEDMEMQPRVFFAAKGIACIKYKFYNYIKRQGSIMKSSNGGRRAASMREILSRWKVQFDGVSDSELQAVLYGYLSKCFLHTCRELHLRNGLDVPGVDKRFLIKTGANLKEKAKACIYAASPHLYSRL